MSDDRDDAGVLQGEKPDKVAQIELLYQQQMTVQIPVYDIPPSPEDAWHLLKNTDPEFVADVIPNRWEDVNSVGDLRVIDIEEVADER